MICGVKSGATRRHSAELPRKRGRGAPKCRCRAQGEEETTQRGKLCRGKEDRNEERNRDEIRGLRRVPRLLSENASFSQYWSSQTLRSSSVGYSTFSIRRIMGSGRDTGRGRRCTTIVSLATAKVGDAELTWCRHSHSAQRSFFLNPPGRDSCSLR